MTEPRDPISMSRQDYQYFMRDLSDKRDKAKSLGRQVKRLERVNKIYKAALTKHDERSTKLRATFIQLNELLDEIIQEHYEEDADHPDEYWS